MKIKKKMAKKVIKFRVIVEESKDLKRESLRPEHIKVSKTNTTGFFGRFETEYAAGRLIKFFQSKGYWSSFTIEELVEFGKKNNISTDGIFDGLFGYWCDDSLQFIPKSNPWREAPPYIVSGGKELLITDLFISACREKSPNKKG